MYHFIVEFIVFFTGVNSGEKLNYNIKRLMSTTNPIAIIANIETIILFLFVFFNFGQ